MELLTENGRFGLYVSEGCDLQGENTGSFHDLTSDSPSVGALESGLCRMKAGNCFEPEASVGLQGPVVP